MNSMLPSPDCLLLSTEAGKAVDEFIAKLVPLLSPGDVIIDGGNSEYQDSERRTTDLAAKGLLFIGTGVSGGEEGARHGPSIMPGGNPAAWPAVKSIFQSIAAKVDGAPCCDWVGSRGAGHFVKMVHNGIEYGDMQVICEAYDLLHQVLGLSHDQMADVFDDWNDREVDSFLIEITRDILRVKDADGAPLVTKIRDSAGQKGTGKWTAVSALDFGIPVTLIGESVFSRYLSSLKGEREAASKLLPGPRDAGSKYTGEVKQFTDQVMRAMYASKIVSYAQGFMLLREASRRFDWDLNFGAIALMWRGGCIIRSVFLGDIKKAFDADPKLTNLLTAPFFRDEMAKCQSDWRHVVSTAVLRGIPTPAFSSALAFYDGYRSAVLPANLLQAQRDYFGAHTYERLDRPAGQWVHTNWTGRGGAVSSSSYNA